MHVESVAHHLLKTSGRKTVLTSPHPAAAAVDADVTAAANRAMRACGGSDPHVPGALRVAAALELIQTCALQWKLPGLDQCSAESPLAGRPARPHEQSVRPTVSAWRSGPPRARQEPSSSPPPSVRRVR